MLKTIRSFLGISLMFMPVFAIGQVGGDLLLRPGLQFQKEHNGFWYNGVSLSLSHQKLWSHRLQLEISYTSSKLGSGINSLALRQDKMEFLPALFFRTDKLWQPSIRLMWGYAYIDTEGFDVYESNISFIYGVGFGSRFAIHPVWGGPNFQFGFNLANGQGVVYPLHSKMSWEFPFSLGGNK